MGVCNPFKSWKCKSSPPIAQHQMIDREALKSAKSPATVALSGNASYYFIYIVEVGAAKFLCLT